MKIRSIALVLTVYSSLVATSYAAENCKNPQTQLEMNTCSAQDFQREDAKLNQNYKELVSKLATKDKEKLKEVQRSWVKFRDLQCALDKSRYAGGSIQPLVYATCMLELTKQRNENLKGMIKDASL